MNNVQVEGGTLTLGKGTVVGLTMAQAAPRLGRMERVGDGIYRLREVQEFKSGERLRVSLDDIPKHFRCRVKCLDSADESAARSRRSAKGAG